MVTGRPCTLGAMTNHARAMLQPGEGYSALASGLRSSHEVVDVVLAAIQVVLAGRGVEGSRGVRDTSV